MKFVSCAAGCAAAAAVGPCAQYQMDTELASATLERHLNGFGSANLSAIMEDYHEDAVLQVPDKLGGTICGTASISAFFSGFFKIKPAGSPIFMRKKETVCPEDSPACISYIWYNMSSSNINFPQAMLRHAPCLFSRAIAHTFSLQHTLRPPTRSSTTHTARSPVRHLLA